MTANPLGKIPESEENPGLSGPGRMGSEGKSSSAGGKLVDPVFSGTPWSQPVSLDIVGAKSGQWRMVSRLSVGMVGPKEHSTA